MKMLLKATAAVAALAVVFGVGWLASGIGIGRVADVDSLSDREHAFTERMRSRASQSSTATAGDSWLGSST